MTEDLFGIDREKKILVSGVRKKFRPHEPINAAGLFFGRQGEVQRIMECMSTPGLHALLFGDRGVGKSSLANIASQVLLNKFVKGKGTTLRCDSMTTYDSLARRVLHAFGIEIDGAAQTHSRTEGGEAGVGLPGVAKGGISTSTTVTSSREALPADLSPSRVAELLAGKAGLVVIDEFDAIPDAAHRRSLAEVMKLLSDSSSDVKLLVVGVAGSAHDLLAGHPSVQRNLREVELPKMSDTEIERIVSGNAKACGLTFDFRVVEEIVELSAGYPHFAQLLGLACAESAVADDRRSVEARDMQAALVVATHNAEESLRRAYGNAVRSATTEGFRDVLHAAASLNAIEFTAAEWRNAIAERTGDSMPQNRLNNYLQRLVADDNSRVLLRVHQGMYRFTDPRMRSYARIVDRSGEGHTLA